MFEIFTEIAILIFFYMLLWFIEGTLKKNNSIIDVGWGFGFCVIALYTLFFYSNVTLLQLTITALTFIWGLRLTIHIYKRNKNKPEDFRYAQWRKDWGKWVIPRAFLQIYMLQGLCMFIIALPIVIVNTKIVAAWKLPATIGLIVWIVGFLCEATADYQLKQFLKAKKKTKKKRNKEQAKTKKARLTTGLWKYTRHPNYFGEATQWWGLAIMALSVSKSTIALLSPITITGILLFISIPMLEKKHEKDKAYQKYKKVTNKFFPWFPKKL